MAYADPGSGAMFVQIILAAIVGCLFRVRSVINRFRRPKLEPQPDTFPALNDNSLVRPSK